ncbi:hypothetical protein IW245_000702 [Longispora fulva]|uniref:Uncharacterized protein n=1 Tax=Longispora fulva TaxID=619741 RepID=A0A8J7G6C3_9ACTN|nr:hypothetical protein [Longispora fulva]
MAAVAQVGAWEFTALAKSARSRSITLVTLRGLPPVPGWRL